jgi:hypothetical protein
MMRSTRANKPNGYLLGSYRIAAAPEPKIFVDKRWTCYGSVVSQIHDASFASGVLPSPPLIRVPLSVGDWNILFAAVLVRERVDKGYFGFGMRAGSETKRAAERSMPRDLRFPQSASPVWS